VLREAFSPAASPVCLAGIEDARQAFSEGAQ
jgi:hypothetical protein